MRVMRWILAVGLVIVLSGVAGAQDTGGSIGGGDWGGGGGGGGDYSGGGSYSSGGSDYSYSGGGSDYSSGGGGGGSLGAGGIGAVIVVVVIGFAVSMLWEHLKRERSLGAVSYNAYGGGTGAVGGDADVT